MMHHLGSHLSHICYLMDKITHIDRGISLILVLGKGLKGLPTVEAVTDLLDTGEFTDELLEIRPRSEVTRPCMPRVVPG